MQKGNPNNSVMIPIKITSPTCEDLGIPRECDDHDIQVQTGRRIIHPALHIDGLLYEASVMQSNSKSDPFSPLCMIPLPHQFPFAMDTSFVRKRNERERERVKCVNDGYIRLKESLPRFRKGKRTSKVDTLRGAIDYIKHLESILSDTAPSAGDHNCFKTVVIEPHHSICNANQNMSSECQEDLSKHCTSERVGDNCIFSDTSFACETAICDPSTNVKREFVHNA